MHAGPQQDTLLSPEPLHLFNALMSPLFQAVAAVVFCFLCKKFFQRQTWQLRAETLCKMILIRRNAQPFPREATNGRFAINLNTSFHRTDHFHSALPTAPVIKTGFARSSFSKKFVFWNYHQVVFDVFYHVSISLTFSSVALSPWFRCFFSQKPLAFTLDIVLGLDEALLRSRRLLKELHT